MSYKAKRKKVGPKKTTKALQAGERKLADEARLRLAAIVESSEDAIISKTLDAIITSWNAGAQRIFGYTEEEAVGQPITLLIPPERRDEENRILARLRAGERIEHFETVRVTKTGKRVNVSLSISPIRDSSGKIAGFSKIARDITDRKLAEQELARVNQRLHLAIESGSAGVWDYDVKSGKHVWSGKAQAQLGLTPQETSGSPEEFWAAVHADDRERLQRALQVARDTHEEFADDFRVVWRDGTTHWLRSRGRCYYAADGEPERMLGISIDITESKQAEQSLRDSEQRLRLANQVGRMYAYDWDVTTDEVIRSSEHLTILGLKEPRRFYHRQFIDKIHPDDRAKFLAATADITPEDPTRELTYRALASDGRWVWLKSNGRGFFDAEGRLLRVIGMVADVTDQKLAEEKLRLSEERLRLAQQAARIGTFEWNIQTGVDTWSPELESMYGLPPGGFGRTQTAFENLVHPDDRARVIELDNLSLRTGQPMQGEWRVVWPDGSVHWIAGRWQVLMDQAGEPSRMIGVNSDVTERKLAEEALSSMTRKLVEAQERERARIGRELHDDINQRLAILTLELQRLQENPSELQSRVRELRQETIEISNDVQALAHELHPAKLEYLGVIAGIKSWCREFGERQKVEIHFKNEVHTALPFEVGLCLLRVLQEALHNSVKHSGVKRIEVELTEQSNEVRLIVCDLGRGFDTREKRGRGLGLTSMQERVRLVNGTIMIDSKPAGGTTIQIRVPFGSERAAERTAG